MTPTYVPTSDFSLTPHTSTTAAAAAAMNPLTTYNDSAASQAKAPHLHPLHLLDQFLLSLPKQNEHHSNSNDNEQILQISEFLYGGKHDPSSSDNAAAASVVPKSKLSPAGSILESALELLDEQASSYEEEDPLDDNGERSSAVVSGAPAPAPVRLLIAKSARRKVLVVRGSSKGRVGGAEYLCTMGSCISATEAGAGAVAAGRMGYHCSCRSFFERLRSDRFALCKHLLAARLAPFLDDDRGEGDDHHDHDHGNGGSRIYEEEEVEDEEFGRIYARLSLALG